MPRPPWKGQWPAAPLLLFCVFLTQTSTRAGETEQNPPPSTSSDDESLIPQSAKQHFLDAIERSLVPKPIARAKLQHPKTPGPPFVLADVELQCAEGWEPFERKCLKAVPIERSWPQALAFCSRFGAVLARVESARENAFLSRLLAHPQLSAGSPSTSEHWIGLLHRPGDDSSGGTFLWSDGTRTSRYVGHWARGQPDAGKGSCTKASLDNQSAELSWRLDVCNLLLPFACERPACLKGSFFCHNGVCLTGRARCNGVDDCGDSSDELNCPTAHSETSCQRYEKAESGRIDSPNFPNSYRAGTNCLWVLEGPINSRIQLSFDSFETEEHQDLVTVLDGGPSENTTIALATLSGSPRQALSFESSTNRMAVRFRADQAIQARGFQATWRAVSASCGGLLRAQSLAQQLNSPEWPQHYPNGMECVWRIQAPEGQLISLSIEEFDSEPERDFLLIYDGSHPSAPVLARLSGRHPEPQLLVSTQSQLYLFFFASQSANRKGFSIAYKKGCDNLLRRSHGVLTSPGNAHLPYAPSQTCRWTIELPTPQSGSLAEENGDDMPSLTLALNSWDVAGPGDSLQMFEGGVEDADGGRALHPKEEGFDAENAPPRTVFARKGRVELIWRSNGPGAGTGWNISFSTSCPQLALPSRRVQLSTKNTAFGVKVAVSCERGFEFVTGRGRHFDTQCELGGRWSEPGPVPDCQPVYCSPIPQIANGFAVSATNVSFAGMARFRCYQGFSFASGKEQEEIFCTDEGRWTLPPKCKTDHCPALAAFHFGERTLQFGDGIGYGSVYAFQCAKGYRREGAASIVCQPNGQWSAPQAQCKKLLCSDLPAVPNGEFQRILSEEKPPKEEKSTAKGIKARRQGQAPLRELEFGETLRVECRPGFRSTGAETVKCLANRTLSGVAECTDTDECAEQLANCAPKSTQCLNLAGGYHCRCQKGYSPQLSCAGSNQASIPPSAGRTSIGVPIPVHQLVSKAGWCDKSAVAISGNSSSASQATFIFTFPVPKVIEKLRLERVVDPSLGVSAELAPNGVFPARFVLSYSLEEGVVPQVYTKGATAMGTPFGGNGTANGEREKRRRQKTGEEEEAGKGEQEPEGLIRTKTLGTIGAETLVLSEPVEALSVRVEVLEFVGGMPCMKLEFLGCQRTSCEDVNECADGRNGGCEHQCHNTQGGHRCSCEEGFDLFVAPGQSGVRLREGETGTGERDSLRFNRSCIPRHCAPLGAPPNGQLVVADNSSFAFPTVVEFRCAFGHQMRGPSHLKCLADGTWNGTAPTCIPASCSGVKNSTAIGLFVQPDSVPVPFGSNLSFVCSQTNRPAKHTPLGEARQCIYDPRTDGLEYWLSGPDVDCPLVDCGPPPALSGAYYEGDEGHGGNFKVGSVYLFQCRAPYSLVGKSSYDDRMVRCNVDGTWDLGDLRCEGPVCVGPLHSRRTVQICVDPGHPDDGQTHLESVEEGAIARFTCNRPGYAPFPADSTSCSLGTACVLSEDVGISTGFIPDGAFSDNSDKTIWGYEPHKARMSSSGWCGSKDAFIFLSVDLQRIYTLTTIFTTGVAGNGHLAGHVTKMQLFYKVQFSQNYDNYPTEFTTPSGNHKKIHQFVLDPPLRARYILLGITEYEKNPCMKFDLHGCLAPLSAAHEVPAHLQVGWNASVPQCVDSEPPVFRNCPQTPVVVQTDEHGQLLPVSYIVPEASDNSGRIAYMRTKPEEFHPPFPVSQDTDIAYQAFDDAGNMAECVVRLRIPDTVPPIVKCPDSYALWAAENQTQMRVHFNESSVRLVVQDTSPISQTSFDPSEALIHLNEHVIVEVSVTDAHSNRNKCKFQVALLAEPCSSWSLPVDSDTVERDCQRHASGAVCQVRCRKGHRFVGIEQQRLAGPQQKRAELALPQRYSCSLEERVGKWTPSASPPACVPIALEPARYEMRVHMDYSLSAPLPSECLNGFEFLASSLFDGIDQVLSQRCSSTVQIYVRFLDAKFSPVDEKTVGANFTVQILPTVLQPVFYDLCSLTLRTIFDLRIPGATQPIRSLLSLTGDSVPAAQGLGCPSMNSTGIRLSQGFTCSSGELLKEAQADDASLSPAPGLPECLPCPLGTFFANNSCVECPLGSFQDRVGQTRCKQCPDGTHTLQPGSQRNDSCLALCGNGMSSPSGMIPCQLCPRHTFAGPPPPGGYRECEPCPEGTYTARLGSVGPSQCKQPCTPGHFSVSGLEPCSPCPVNFYQPNIGQQRCLQCSNDSHTQETGRFAEEHCKKLDCQTVKCQNRGQCVVANHKEICECRPGFTGPFCEQQVPLCDSKPCLNAGTCELHNGAFRCICAQNFTGSRCQFGPDECISAVHCPNGGVCQDLPGLGTTKCICRTGFTGPDCSEIADPCKSEQPCRNGADCVPMQLGRYKCKCLPGWEGQNCERNIDDCADSPCALGAKCHDLINDFECECPHGFSGKRCQIKDNLCEPNPCLNAGQCVDTLFDRHCVCKSGWNGTFCEQKVNECAHNPCQNGATCRDQEGGYECECAPGFHGFQCQYMVDHCAIAPCRNNATCVNQGPSYECQCLLGFEGIHCEHDVDECETLMPCDGTGTERCEDLVDGYRCLCRPGYEGTFCEQHVSQCEEEPCANNGTCVDLGSGFQCECQSGWRGERCEQMQSQCERKPCLNEGKCVPLVADYFCVCPEGVSGKNCELAPNRCLGEPCRNGGVCGDFGSRSECACPKGFTGLGCQYRLDACRAGVCQNGGTCVEGGEADGTLPSSSYKCLCPPGFAGVDCETDINECHPSPCPLAAECVDLVNGFYCKCPFNTTGANCEKQVDPDYDLHFLESVQQPARAGLGIPFRLAGGALSLSIWVRFDGVSASGDEARQQQAPVFFSLYQSGSPNQPANLSELLRISSDAVLVRLFPDRDPQPVVLHFPAHQRPDTDRVWNNLVFTWSSHQGAYSLVWNAVRLYADRGYAKDAQLDINAWVNLGNQLPPDSMQIRSDGAIPDTRSGSPVGRFAGRITRVNLWSRVLDFEADIPAVVQRCQGAPVNFPGLVLRFANYDRIEGKVERVAKSSCGRSVLQCRSCAGAEERPAVEVRGCPAEDLFVHSQHKEVNVSWQEPSFESASTEVQIARVEQNLKPGQVLSWGQFNAIYVALDNRSAPLAQCQFRIHVLRERCAEPDAPINGVQQCEQWGPGLRYRACSVQCAPGHGFGIPPAVFYACADDGEWRPNEAGRRPFRYPQCTRTSPAEHLARIRLSYPLLSLCNPVGKSSLSERLLQRIAQLDSKWHICAESSPDAGCAGVSVQIRCEEGPSMFRSKRQPLPQNGQRRQFDVTIDVPVLRGPLSDPAGGQQRLEAAEVIREEALLRGLFSLEQALPNGRPDLGAFGVEDAFRCTTGLVLLNDTCVPCSPGTFFLVSSGQCQLCPVGQFQPMEAQTECEACPLSHPVTVGLGATRESECRVRCLPGHHLDIVSGECQPCGFGFFQSESGSFRCLPCGVGKTTLERTATSEDQCRDECPDGEQLTAAGSCQPCPVGTFRTRGRDKQCLECPPGTITEHAGAADAEACNTPKCQPGQFLVVAERRCEFCARGAFQDQWLQTQCKKCPPAYTTAREGAIWESQCYSTDQCALGQDNCSWNAQCVDLPDENDVPSWKCVCNPGFRGNGVNCTDACQNFCLNDGQCRKNKLGHVECNCKENFSGERCEIRFQPRSQRLAYWTGAIVAVVFLLIIVVVVIWMISLRFSRSTERNSYMSAVEKPSVFASGGGLPPDSPMASNFLYGRAPPLPLERSHSSLAGSIRPIGFYYEDEQPYEHGSTLAPTGRHARDGSSQEVKSMFLAEGSESTAHVTALGGSSGSESEQSNAHNANNGSSTAPNSATRELEQRLRHVQQHMYRPEQ